MSAFDVPTSLSPSRASSFQDCPLQFRFASIQGLPQPPGFHAVKGNVVHRALEMLLRLSAPERTREAAREAMTTSRNEYEPKYDFVGLELDDAAAREFWTDCGRLVDAYFDLEDPTTLDDVELELWVEAPLGTFNVRGYIDRLERAPDGGLVITDYKTGRAPRESDVGNKMRQLEMYAYMLRALRGELPSRMRLMYLKDKVVLERRPTESSMEFLEKRTIALFGAIERACTSGTFPPKRSGLCNFCNFKQWCPEFGGNPELAAVEAPLKYPRLADS
jgi:putative RecB family exonuclease